ncbi:MAG: glycine--tRNA ligase, partial [Candidatus Staskawiczbacteria bacterium]|nr:glycine--tRNA ligase [Candidatus Staskawiczbacteria bacterium]
MELMEKIVSLCKRRGFVFPGSEIYGGLANSFDYGPLGVELKNNIKRLWWKRFVHERDDMVGIDAALIMNPKVWEASGHLENFSDPLVECKKCHHRFREDTLESKKCPDCKGELMSAKQFNLMLKTFLGPVESDESIVYFRPETAQAMFVDFKNVLDTTRRKLPFGIAQIGKAFRNEITLGNFIFRTREFEQMEIEYFIKKEDWKKVFEMWKKEMWNWMTDELGLLEKNIHELDIP